MILSAILAEEGGERMLAYPPRALAPMIVGREAVGAADAQEVTAWREALEIDVDRLAEIAERCVDLADPEGPNPGPSRR